MVQFNFEIASETDAAVYYNIARKHSIDLLYGFPYTGRCDSTISGRPSDINEFLIDVDRYKKRKKLIKILNKTPFFSKIKNIFN